MATTKTKSAQPLQPLQFREDSDPLFSYQEKVVNYSLGDLEHPYTKAVVRMKAHTPGRVLFEIDPGLGKSRMAIEIMGRLAPAEKILIICSRKALNTWRREWPKWCILDRELVIIEGTPAKRRKLWGLHARIYVVTYQSAKNDFRFVQEHSFQSVICDEAKVLRNRKTKLFKFWRAYLSKMPRLIIMDGTIVSRGPQDLWTYLAILRPNLFRSFWKFVNTFCIVFDGPWGKEIGPPQNTKALAQQLAPVMIKLDENNPEVADQRPPLIRDRIPLDMTKEQRGLYTDLSNNLLAITPSGKIVVTPSQMGLIIKLRQLLVCPKIIDPVFGYGAAIENLLLQLEDDPHVVIFTPFKPALGFMRDAMVEAGFQPPYILQGGASPDDVKMVEEGFAHASSEERSVLCTVTFAESFEFPSARQCFFNGFEWSQLFNIQAEKRLHRATTKHKVMSYYYVHHDSADEHIADVLNMKEERKEITFQHYLEAIRLYQTRGVDATIDLTSTGDTL